MSVLALFQTSQCSWCRKFYTNEGFLCPLRHLQSNCVAYDKLSTIEAWFWREKKQEQLLPRIVDMMGQVVNKGKMARCRYSDCGVLNPNPQATVCWKCGKGLCCPNHSALILEYNIKEDYWECPDTAHGGIFHMIDAHYPYPTPPLQSQVVKTKRSEGNTSPTLHELGTYRTSTISYLIISGVFLLLAAGVIWGVVVGIRILIEHWPFK